MELTKEKEGKRAFFVPFILSERNFLTFVFYLNIKYTLRIYILLHIKKHYFIHFFENPRKHLVYPQYIYNIYMYYIYIYIQDSGKFKD